MSWGKAAPAGLGDGGTGNRVVEMAPQQSSVSTPGKHLTLRLEAVRVLEGDNNAEMSEQFLPSGHVEGVCRPRAPGADAQQVQWHIQGYEPILGNISRRFAVEAAGGEGSEREEEEGSAPCGGLRVHRVAEVILVEADAGPYVPSAHVAVDGANTLGAEVL
jgi:hypothetical protein